MTNKSCSLKGNQKLFILQNNQTSSCCQAEQITLDSTKPIEFYFDKWNQEKQLLDNGVELPGCESCWQRERRGQQSFRQKITSEVNCIDIFLSNLCNQMCSYCSPRYSSEWQRTIQETPFHSVSNTVMNNLAIVPTDNQSDYWINQIISYVNNCSDNSVVIKLLGGEPLMQFRNLEIFSKFNPNKIKTFEIVTNLNVANPKFLQWMINSFEREKLMINISIDATPEYNHVPRGKFDKDQFVRNLALLQDNQITFAIQSVLSVLSVFDLKNFMQWIDVNQFQMQMNSINNPDCLDIHTVSMPVREEILESIQPFKPSKFIQQSLLDNTPVVDLKLFEQYNYLTQYFERTNINPWRINNLGFQQHWNKLEEKFKQ
jgi:organic radical activating enzyme